jgi:predicted DNA-binding transcriptional regulator AlpA
LDIRYANGDSTSMTTAKLDSLANSAAALIPRFIRLRDAPHYLGMDKNRFNREVRPQLTSIPIGKQGIAFDRLEVDAWAEDYVRRNGRPAAVPERRKSWDNVNRLVSPCAVGSGISTKTSTERAFAKALAQAISGKP